MKRIIGVVLALTFFLCGCSGTLFDDTNETIEFDEVKSEGNKIINTSSFDFVGSWLTYMELKPKSFDITKEEYESQIEEIIKNLHTAKVNNLFVQVRPFADAIYPSKYFPSSRYVVRNQGDKLPFDFFEVIIDVASKYSIGVHAWINPFRIQSEFDPAKLCDNSQAKKWYKEKGNFDVAKANAGLYFNPASINAQKLILCGVRELLENYDIKGIHIDDYFYPTTDKEFDEDSYKAYKNSGGRLSLDNWRRENINSLVSSIYNTVKEYGSDKIFSISPCGDIEKNKEELYADCEKWCNEKGFCDYIIPQIYYGFQNEKLPFEECAKNWKELAGDNVKIVSGLALYKAGKKDAFAGDNGKTEWQTYNDIIKRQTEVLKELNYDGFCLYSAGFVNFMENSFAKEMKNLNNVV